MNSTTGITYDEAGNVTADPKFRGMQYKYDANGRMIWSATTANTQQADAVYDGMGQRVATQVGGVWRYMVYDVGGRMIAEYGGGDAQGSGGVHYQLSDHQGSVRAVMNENGWIAGRHDYQPFGEEIGAGTGQRTIEQGYNAPSMSRQKYGMTERDEATGLDHTTWRKYEQNAGRWTSPDPLKGKIGDPQSFNRFTYSGNDPVNFVDPFGLEKMICFEGVNGETVCLPSSETLHIGTSAFADWMFVHNSRFGGHNFMTDLNAFLDAKPKCRDALGSLTSAMLANTARLKLMATRERPELLNKTPKELGGTALMTQEDQNRPLSEWAKGSNAMTNVDQQEVYFFDNYFTGSQSAVERGRTVFHEGLHAFLRMGHVDIMAHLGETWTPIYFKSSPVIGQGLWGINIYGPPESIYAGDERSAAEGLNNWLEGGCK